jgi:hypothetical protein
MLYGYVGGSGKKLNQEVIGPDFIRTIIDCGYRVALERYIFEVSSPKKSEDVLELFADGIADWEAKEPRGQKAHGDHLRPVLDAPRRHQQAAER